jgi:hypothetical protein
MTSLIRETIDTAARLLGAGPAEPLLLSQVLEEEFADRYGTLTYTPPAGEDDRIKACYKAIHELDPPRSALCLSGGGIRSSTFCLGALQGFARRGLLAKFHYLSTVSGGGYVGSWLSAWIRRRGLDAVAGELGASQPAADSPVQYLREYSNYLTPKLGGLSGDAWAVVATVLRNLILNWLSLIPALLLLTLVPRLWLALFLVDLPPGLSSKVGWLAVLLLLVAVAYICADLPSGGDRRWKQSRFFLFCLAPMTLASFAGPLWYYYGKDVRRAAESSPYVSFAAVGAALYLVALVFGMLARRRRPRSTAERKAEKRPWQRTRLALASVTTGGLAGAGLLLLATQTFERLRHNTAVFATFAPAISLGFMALIAAVYVGASSKITTDEDREWWSRAAGYTILVLVIWTLGALLVIQGPDALGLLIPRAIAAAGGITGVVAALLGFSNKTSWRTKASPGTQAAPQYVGLLMTAGPPLFVAALVTLLSWVAARLAAAVPEDLSIAPLYVFGILGGGFGAVAALASWFIHVNKFSLHAMYRNRLIRAFLGASRPDRDPNPFIRFDDDDNIEMADLSREGPLHVVNMALNLVHDRRLAWQQRKAESFTATRLHAGTAGLGYRPSNEYGEGISLGTAAAISGAAASPNMGYHSSPAVTFLMTFFNARLGWWLGNPGAPGKWTWRSAGPRFGFLSLVSEALGRTSDVGPYVYLSDGGHFDNLGLYEMVLRRCHTIVAIDAGCDDDFTFADLGNAIRKIRIDMGVPITFPPMAIKKYVPGEPAGAYCAVGKIEYSLADEGLCDGTLIYIKPTLTGSEPPDVLEYHASHPDFPHEPTADQWFAEAQFESYRALGEHIVMSIWSDAAAAGSAPPPSPPSAPAVRPATFSIH